MISNLLSSIHIAAHSLDEFKSKFYAPFFIFYNIFYAVFVFWREKFYDQNIITRNLLDFFVNNFKVVALNACILNLYFKSLKQKTEKTAFMKTIENNDDDFVRHQVCVSSNLFLSFLLLSFWHSYNMHLIHRDLPWTYKRDGNENPVKPST